MSDYDVIIIGGGPSGCSAAIRLAEGGARVLLLEEKRMPREKLCGEFITPECFPTLNRLRVMDRMLAAGAEKLHELNLVTSAGRVIHTPIADMSEGAAYALSLSRARFDHILFERAREAGAHCVEGVAVRQTLFDGRSPRGVEAIRLPEGTSVSFSARLIVDGSGRNSRLTVGRTERVGGPRGSRLYGLKAHLRGVEGITDQVELYFFPQGYGGLSRVEDGLINLCFIASESAFARAGGDPRRVVEKTVMKNPLARARLGGSRAEGKWLSVGPLKFGRRRLSLNGVIAIGDASGMIDPFTGTGIQIALRTGEIAAEAILAALGSSPVSSAREGAAHSLMEDVLSRYRAQYDAEFGKRMAVAGLLRRAAFSPHIAGLVATLLSRSPALARTVLRATRSGPAAGRAIRPS